jgi:hypothetical protein
MPDSPDSLRDSESWSSRNGESIGTSDPVGQTRRLTILLDQWQVLIVFVHRLGTSLDLKRIIDCLAVPNLPTGLPFDAEYFCSNVLHDIHRNRQTGMAEDNTRNFGLHFHNAVFRIFRATIRFLNQCWITKVLHLSFSPDLAPCAAKPEMQRALLSRVEEPR